MSLFMNDDIQNTSEKLIGTLNQLVSKPEQIYPDLGRDYPLLLQELDRSTRESAASADNMSSGGSLDSIDLVIDESVRITDNFNSSFTSMYSRDGELFEIIQRGISEMATSISGSLFSASFQCSTLTRCLASSRTSRG